MFGLTPRTPKSGTPPKRDVRSTAETRSFDKPSAEETRLTHALEEVLAKPIATHRINKEKQANVHRDVAAPVDGQTALGDMAKQTTTNHKTLSVPLDVDDREFQWLADKDEDTQDVKTMSARWLKRAQRQNRLARVQRVAQWVLIAAGIGALVILTLWPGLT